MWMGRASSPSSRSERKTSNFRYASAIPARGYPRSRQIRSLMPSLRPNSTAPEWGFASADPSLSRMAAACGLPTTLRAAQVFTLLYPPKSTHMKTPPGSPTVLVIDDDVRAAIQGLLKSAGLRPETFGTAQDF